MSSKRTRVGNKTVTYKGTCRVLDDAATKAWFYPTLAARRERIVAARQRSGWRLFAQFLDSPRRVILEGTPTQRIGYDGAKMGKATAKWIASNAI